MSTVADNVVVADDPISNGHQVHDGASSFETPSKLVTEGEAVEAASNGVQESALGAEDVSGAGDNTDDTLVTASSEETLAAETSVGVLGVTKLVDDMEPEAPSLHASDSDKENTTLIHDSEPLANGHHKSLFVEESEQLTTLTIASCDKPASLAELDQEDAIDFSGTVISEMPKDELPIADSTDTEIPFVDVATVIVEASKASLDDGEPPIAASTGPDSSLSDLVTTSINGVGSTTDAEPSHCQDETPISRPSTEMSPTADMLEEVVVPPAVAAEEISPMAAEPELAVVEHACDPIEAEANPIEVEASSVGEESAVTKTVVPVSIDSVAETAPEGENLSDEPESALVEAESALVETQSSTAEPGITQAMHEAAPIKPTLREVVVEESPACEPDAEPAAILEPTPEATELEPVEDTAVTVEPGTEVAESDPTEGTVLVSEAVATATTAEISGAEAEEFVAEVDTRITVEKEANEEPQVAIGAEDEPTAPTEPEVEVFFPEVVSTPAEAATGPDVLSTESEESAIAPTMTLEVPVESVVAAEAESVDAHDSISADPEPVTVPDLEPIAATEADSVAAPGPEPATVESEAPAAVDAELTEPAVESLVVETVQIDVEPPSSNASFVEDPEVGFAYADEPQTPLAGEIPVFEEPVLDAADVESEVQVEESSVEETVEVIPIDAVTPTGEPAPVEEVAAEEVVAVEVVVTVEEFPVEEPAAVEETVLVEETTEVEETIPAEEVIPVDVATGEPASIKEVPSVEAVAIEEHAAVEEITLVEDVTPIESAALVESSQPVEEAVVNEAEPTVEELAAHVDDGPVLEETMPSVYAADVEVPLPTAEVSSPEEPAASIEEPLIAPEEAFAETAAPVISLAGDASTVQEAFAPLVEVLVGEDVPAVEEHSALAEADVPESGTVEELSASVEEHAPVAVEDTPVREDQPIAIEETLADAEEPVSVDDRIPHTMEETPLLAEALSDADGLVLEATSAAEEPYVPEEESATVVVLDETITEAAVVVSVEEDIHVVEEPLEPSDVEAPEPVVHEEAVAPTGDHEPVAVEDIPVQPVTIEETPATEEASVSVDDQIPLAMSEISLIAEVASAADELILDDSPTTEEPSAPEEEPTAASIVEVPPTAGEVAAAPEEITSKAEETIPVFEAAPTTPAAPMLDDASSPEGTTIVAEESTVDSDASVTQLPVAVEEPAPAASEASVVVEVVLEDIHATLEHAENALLTGEETKNELEDSRHAEAPVSLPEQPFGEDSLPTAPIVEEFAPVPAEPEMLEQLHVVTSQVPVNGEHSEVDKDSEPPIAHVEISSEIEVTEAVEQPDATAVEEVTEQQEIATSSTLNVATGIERPKSPWTPSYSVMTQGPGVPDEEHVNAYEGDDDAAPAQSQTPEIIVDEVAAVVPEAAADTGVSGQSQVEVLQLAEEQVTLGEPEELHPKSPWTPSYSVTVQGNVAQTNEGLDDLEQLPPSAVQSVAAEAFEEQPVPFTEALISGDVTSSTTVVADIHATLSATLDESDVPDSAVEAETLQDVASEQGDNAEAEPSVLTPPEPATVEEVPEEEIEQGSFIVGDESTQLGATDPDRERSSSPWTPSYSVTGLEPTSALEDQAVAKDGEFVEHGSFIIETQPPAVVEDAPEVKSDSELLTPVDDLVGERPKSPWTPSYSVTKQGPNDAVEEVEKLDELEHLPGPLSNIPALATDEVPIPPVLITTTRASVDEPVMAETPSCSEDDVTVSELSKTYDDVEASGALIAQETPQTFPVLEEPQKIANKKPSLSAVDELNAAEVTESSTLHIDIPTNNGANRNRLESTTSSRFFPGGWFSSSPKVPEEGRASLDVAAGEFVHKSSVENTPTTDPTTAPPSAVEEDKEKKSRWCTIM
ncbi:hypothetical protein EV702DRAFT_1090745 [Suillus placidus]|uniref:Uncharacterized protein n=1 Tax=Suillus placidus TaxID=48579 RepID=A0A9P7A0E2_9AGAM|nr:hypothetical protein EV702DRAFT_1090745 [Suillus placidus]